MPTGKYMTVTEPISRNFPESLKSCLPESPDGVLHLVTATKAQNRSMKVFSVVTAGGAGGRHYKPDARASDSSEAAKTTRSRLGLVFSLNQRNWPRLNCL